MANEGGPALELNGKRLVLLLQGGGALGAYQVGAFTALEAACRRARTRVEWVGGVSIGAINAAVIAAPTSGDAVAELASLWDAILSPPVPPFDFTSLWLSVPPFLRSGPLAQLVPKYANWMWTAYNPAGQPNFFSSRVLNPLANPWILQWIRALTPAELAFYDTERLRKLLDEHVAWETVNRIGRMRLSLGATRVSDGEVVYFNSFESQNPAWGRKIIGADHVRASGALPPAFPGIEIDAELYWDGGLSSNTPIEALYEDLTADAARNTLVFLIDLWDRKAAIPRSLDDVVWRQKSIQYSSRKNAAVAVVDAHELAVEAHRIPPTRLEVCQVMLEQPRGDANPQFAFADADFSRTTHERLVKLGQDDMQRAIASPHRVAGVGGEYAALYRFGTYGKHLASDGKYAAMSDRRRRRFSASNTGKELSHA